MNEWERGKERLLFFDVELWSLGSLRRQSGFLGFERDMSFGNFWGWFMVFGEVLSPTLYLRVALEKKPMNASKVASWDYMSGAGWVILSQNYLFSPPVLFPSFLLFKIYVQKYTWASQIQW